MNNIIRIRCVPHIYLFVANLHTLSALLIGVCCNREQLRRTEFIHGGGVFNKFKKMRNLKRKGYTLLSVKLVCCCIVYDFVVLNINQWSHIGRVELENLNS